MLIAHLPAGYIVGTTARLRPALFGVVLLASVLPDIDLVWFYLVDGRAIHHHRYWLHAPGFWLVISLVGLPVLAQFRRQWLAPALICCGAILLHLLLDTPVGGIMWLWPASGELFVWSEVPASRSHWVLSFVFHWSFLAELLICALALALFSVKRFR